MLERIILAAGAKWLEKKLLQDQQAQQPQHQVISYDGKDQALLAVKRKAGSITTNIGTRETGKSELSYRIAEFFDRPTFAVSPQQRPPRWIKRINLDQIVADVPEMSTLILDDLPSYASNRDYNDQLVRVIEHIIPMVRHERQPPDFPVGKVHLIFNTQSAAQADKYILDCDLAFFKPLGLLYADLERPAIKKIYQEIVMPLFDGHTDPWIQRHAFMFSRSWKGLIEYHMSEKLPR